jgi:hypothetical protein
VQELIEVTPLVKLRFIEEASERIVQKKKEREKAAIRYLANKVGDTI